MAMYLLERTVVYTEVLEIPDCDDEEHAWDRYYDLNSRFAVRESTEYEPDYDHEEIIGVDCG